jgi:dihydroceramide fatty acyl 2-hydroxylase
MSHLPIDRSPTPIRLFQSDFLEFFTHISPVVGVLIWLPVAVFFIVRASLSWAGPRFPTYIPLAVLAGIFGWTFAEYTLHRFVFHFRARRPWQERVIFLFHGIHHAQPQSKTRLVMPPVVSSPLWEAVFGTMPEA